MMLKNLLYSFVFLVGPIYVRSHQENVETKLVKEGTTQDNEGNNGAIHVDPMDQLKGNIKFVLPYYN